FEIFQDVTFYGPVDHWHEDARLTEHRASAGDSTQRALPFEFTCVTLADEKNRTVHHGDVFVVGRRRQRGMITPSHLARPEGSARLRIDRMHYRLVGMDEDHTMVERHEVDSPHVPIDINLDEPAARQPVPF